MSSKAQQRLRKRWSAWIGLMILAWGLVIACRAPGVEPLATLKDCHTVEHLMGQTCIPHHPQRIVVLHDSTLLDPLLALKFKPIAVATYPDENGQPFLRGIPSNAANSLAIVGTPDQPNLETILNLRPDLIIGREFQQEFYAQLQAIAPTIMIRWDGTSFKEHLRTLADLLNQTSAAEQVLANYQERIQQFQRAMGGRLSTLTVSVLTVQDAMIKTFGYQSTMGEVLQDAGIQRPSAQEQSQGRVDLSLETLPAHDADVIFLIHESGDTIETYQRSALWNQLRAVKFNQVYQLEAQNWIVAGPLGANRILDDLFKYLL